MFQKLILAIITSGLLITSAHAQTDKVYPLVVAFNSFANGVPDSKPLEDYIKDFKKYYKIKSIAADQIGPLGREGEYKLAFPLKELTKKQRNIFMRNVKNVVLKMSDRGSAELLQNYSIIVSELPSRATITTKNF